MGLMSMPVAYVEKPIRSAIKSISYRVFGSLTTALISFVITGKVSASLSIGFMDFIAKFALFYIHERLWNRIKIGREPVKVDYEI